MNLAEYLNERKSIVDKALDEFMPSEEKEPRQLHYAMRYSIFAGGKRLRPILTLAAAEIVDGNWRDTIPLACAIEMIHTYSLIHDDLPSMDNDDFRRGKPSSHRVFGDAMAILAGDSLLTEAFLLMSNMSLLPKVKTDVIVNTINDVAKAAGSCGMAGGQAVDLVSAGTDTSFPLLEYIHIHKTGALILAAITGGARIGGASNAEIEVLSKYGKSVGLAFQIVDDIMDMDKEKVLADKVTYPSLLGIMEAKRHAEVLIDQAISALEQFGEKAEPLRAIARYIITREK